VGFPGRCGVPGRVVKSEGGMWRVVEDDCWLDASLERVSCLIVGMGCRTLARLLSSS
jgi:hypothetical protein